MPRRIQKPVPEHLQDHIEVDVPGLWNVYLLGLGIALLIGFVGGGLYIAWRLLVAPWFK